MTFLPAITRELRSQARQGFTYGLRVIGAASLLFVATLFVVNSRLSPHDGGGLFGNLNTTLFVAIWILAPLLAADCISRERREGTLGLLFLTPLKARDIIVAKSFVHGLRAMSLWLSVLPILMLPFMVGGVGWREAVLSVLVNFSSLCLALACGLLASCYCKSWLRAQVTAILLSCCASGMFAFLAGYLVLISARTAGAAMGAGFNPFSVQMGFGMPSEGVLLIGYYSVTDFGGIWADAFAWIGAGAARQWLRSEAWAALVSLLALFLAAEMAAGRLRRIWQEEPPSARQQWLVRVLTTPVVAVSFLRGWMRRKLLRNPIGWLEQRSWSGRLVRWSWLAAMVGFYSVLMGDLFARRSVYALQQFMAWLLLIGLASSAAGSFQRERETGVMELLLVSPMSVGQIIGGRLRGLWGQFLPAIVMLVSVWFYFRTVFRIPVLWLLVFGGGFLTVPVVGLYYSLKRKTYLSAFLSTLFVALLLPFICQAVWVRVGYFSSPFIWGIDDYTLTSYWNGGRGDNPYKLIAALWSVLFSIGMVTVFQLIIALRFGRRLFRDMERRNFTFTRVIN